jgi:hypothetical protein
MKGGYPTATDRRLSLDFFFTPHGGHSGTLTNGFGDLIWGGVFRALWEMTLLFCFLLGRCWVCVEQLAPLFFSFFLSLLFCLEPMTIPPSLPPHEKRKPGNEKICIVSYHRKSFISSRPTGSSDVHNRTGPKYNQNITERTAESMS